MKENLDTRVVNQFCMYYGAIVGTLTSASFLCSMLGLQSAVWGLMSNVLGVMAVYVAGRQVRNLRQTYQPFGFGRVCWTTVQVYLYAILLTGAVQYIYFTFFDKGRLAGALEAMFNQDAYKQMLQSMLNGQDTTEALRLVTEALLSPTGATIQMMWMNIMIALFLLIPTALIAISGGERTAKKKY